VTKNQTHIHAKGLALSLFFVMLAACALPLSNACTQAGAPELLIDSTRRDFGDVFAGELLEQVFVVRNDGSAPLELANKSVTTQSSLLASPDLIKAVSFGPSEYFDNYLLPVRAVAKRAAPS
jgi:hypothetical protein